MKNIIAMMLICLVFNHAPAETSYGLLYYPPNLSTVAQVAMSDIGAIAPGVSPPFVIQEMATPFSLAVQAKLSHLGWAGMYYQPSPPPGQVQFHIRFFAETGTGVLAAPAATPLYDAAVTALVSPLEIVQSQQTYNFAADLPSPFLVQPNTRYWLSVVETDSSTRIGFGWFESTLLWGPAQFAARDHDYGPWLGGDGPGYNMFFAGTIVPEPSNALLLVLGAAAIGAGCCYRAKKARRANVETPIG